MMPEHRRSGLQPGQLLPPFSVSGIAAVSAEAQTGDISITGLFGICSVIPVY